MVFFVPKLIVTSNGFIMIKPIALTLGDPAGIGPELCLQILAKNSKNLQVFGSVALLRRVAKAANLPFSEKNIHDIPLAEPEKIQPGKLSAAAGAHSFACLEKAVKATQIGDFSAVVTNPINKEAWHLAGLSYPGHTEYLVEKTASSRHAMMLTSDDITCSLVTTHLPLAHVPAALSLERILEVIRLTADAMQRLRGRARLLMPGLNPHAGEGGLFGDEESRLLAPALAQARAEGIDIAGPLPADTAFVPSLRAKTDAYVCLYHDQGLIPLKTLAFDHAVNITLGLPIVRTSVDHGTAFDIAWQGKASARSLEEAIKLAQKLADKTT